MQDSQVITPLKPFTTPTLRREIWKKRYEKMVRTVRDSSSISQWAAPVLLTLLLGYNIYDRQSNHVRLDKFEREQQVQHDLLVDQKARKEEREKFNDKILAEINTKIGEQENWRKVLENRIAELKFGRRN